MASAPSNGVAAVTQDLEASRRGKRLARCHGAIRCVDGGTAGQSGGALGRKRDGDGEERRERTGSKDQAEAGQGERSDVRKWLVDK
jgi:hypothetical protein